MHISLFQLFITHVCSGPVIFSKIESEHQLQIWWDTVEPHGQDQLCLSFLSKLYTLKYCPETDPLRLAFLTFSNAKSETYSL